MSAMEDRTPKEDLLVGGLDDWVDPGWACGSTEYTEITDRVQQRTFTLGLIAEVLVEGLMVPGDVDENGHQPWKCTTGEAIERITREWLTDWPDEEAPLPGSVVWLSNTPAGDEIGRSVLAREGYDDGVEDTV